MEKQKRTIGGIIKDALHQLGAAAIIFIIGIVLLNLPAYSKNVISKWENFWGLKEESPLTEFVNDPTKNTAIALETSSNPEIQKKQIPPLDIEISPSDNRLIIPRINENIPIVRVSSESLIRRDWDALEDDIQSALKEGVVHYPGTAVPGQPGNVAITGHSSYFPWDSGRFKDVFALLHEVVEGDDIVVFWDHKKYKYRVTEIKVVLPEDIEILKQTPDSRLTLITCTPVGTNLKRLIVIAEPIEDQPERVLR